MEYTLIENQKMRYSRTEFSTINKPFYSSGKGEWIGFLEEVTEVRKPYRFGSSLQTGNLTKSFLKRIIYLS